ncbi:hypothetical protein D3C74_293020 [compost metagenome]
MGRVLILRDYVNQCYSNTDGDVIRQMLINNFNFHEMVTVSFRGIDSVSSSFVNSAFIDLLENYNFSFIKSHLRFVDTNKTINEAIKRRFSFEVDRKRELIEV